MKIEEIAKTLKVSKSTVSLAINNKAGVSKSTREKVLLFVRDSGYISRTMVKSGQEHTFSKTIKLLICVRPEITTSENMISSSFFMELIQGLEKKFSVLGFTLMFSSIDPSNFLEQIKKIEEEHTSIGVVLLGTSLGKEEIQIASQYIHNLVVLDTFFDFMNVNFVVMNNEKGGYDACSYLVNLGHQNIGYVQSPNRIGNFNFRKRGFIRALEENNLNIPKKNFFTVRNEINFAEKDFKEIITNRFSSLPSALFCENDYIAIGVIKALRKIGKKIPDDISVIGFDNVTESIIISPELTTIDVKKSEMGALAAQRMYDIINTFGNSSIIINSIMNTSLIERKSCKPYK